MTCAEYLVRAQRKLVLSRILSKQSLTTLADIKAVSPGVTTSLFTNIKKPSRCTAGLSMLLELSKAEKATSGHCEACHDQPKEARSAAVHLARPNIWVQICRGSSPRKVPQPSLNHDRPCHPKCFEPTRICAAANIREQHDPLCGETT